MPRSTANVLGFPLRLAGLSGALIALAAAPASCGLDAQGTLFGQGSGGAGGTGGGGEPCAPGAAETCYSGPDDTAGIGQCVAGMRTCDPATALWGPCEGEVVPEPETCSTPADDDCNGEVNEGGDGCGCTPNVDTMPCYSGPSGTEMNAPCAAGTQTCNADGKGYGACEGEMLPAAENCATKDVDENCDGVALDFCPGETHWSRRAGDGAEQSGIGLASDSKGNVIVVGDFDGTIDLGGGVSLQSAGAADAFIAKYSPGGDHIWSMRFGGSGDDSAVDVAVDASDNIVLTGIYGSTIDFGGGALPMADSIDSFVAKLSPDGKHVWSKRLGGGSIQFAFDADVGPTGDVYVAGSFLGTPDFGKGALTNGGGFDFFLVKLAAADGATAWSKGFGDGADQLLCFVATDAQDNPILAGQLAGSVNFGGGVLTSQGQALDVVVAKFSPGGMHIGSKDFGDGSNQAVSSVDIDSAGRILMAGSFAGAVDFGGGALTASGADAFVARLNADLSHSFSASFSGSAGTNQYAVDVVRGAGDSIVVTGSFDTEMDLPGGNKLTGAAGTIYAVMLDPGGAFVWGRVFPGTDGDLREGAVDPDGHVLLTGDFVGGIDFGGGANNLGGAGLNDLFIAKLQK